MLIYLKLLFHRVHDRKMSIFGFCSVLLCLVHSPARLPALVELAPSFIPTIVTQLEALVEAYKGECDNGVASIQWNLRIMDILGT